MAVRNDFVIHVSELLAPAGHVVTTRMFGGHGVYIDGLFMAIIAWDELYLKVDDISKAAFDAESCAPFVYSKDGKQMTMGYRRAPDEAMDAPHLMLPWARRALGAALRTRAAKSALVKSAAKVAQKTPTAKAANGKPAAKAVPKRKPAVKANPSRPAANKRTA